MRMKTSDLIDTLVAKASPVRPLRPPALRAALWLLIAATILALLAISHGLRPDLAVKFQQQTFIVGVAASLLTAVLAAIAAFFVSVPDRSRRWLLLPAPALVVWMSTTGYQCLTDWVSIRSDGMHWGETADCFATVVLTSVPLWIVLLVMLRYTAWLPSRAVGLAGSLAVAALAASALSLFHSIDASAMILMWNFGSAALLVMLGSIFGPKMFAWVAPRQS